MANLSEKINADLNQALKNQDQLTKQTLRLLKSSLKLEEIAKRTAAGSGEEATLNDEEVIKVLKREVKKREEAAATYKQGGRLDLAVREEAEIVCLKAYLPEELSDEALRKLVNEVLANNTLPAGDFGQAMKLVMAQAKGLADGKKVAAMVKEHLSSG